MENEEKRSEEEVGAIGYESQRSWRESAARVEEKQKEDRRRDERKSVAFELLKGYANRSMLETVHEQRKLLSKQAFAIADAFLEAEEK